MYSRQQSMRRKRLWSRVATYTVSTVGSLLILVGLRHPSGNLPTPAANQRLLAASSSARGGVRPSNQRLADEVDVQVLVTPRAAASLAMLPISADSVLPAVSPFVTNTNTSPAPQLTPTEAPATPTPAPAEPTIYQVQAGDNVSSIAERFHLGQDTVVWANNLENDPDQLQVGQELTILPVDGVLYTVKQGDTLSAIAQRFQAQADAIAGYAPNHIGDNGMISIGQKLLIPGGIKPQEARAVAQPVQAQPAASQDNAQAALPATGARVPLLGSALMIPNAAGAPTNAPAQPGRFAWPVSGLITQSYGTWHGGIDIANSAGSPIGATDGGTIAFAGWSGGLGNAIEVDHGDGFVSVYAHLQAISVQVGQTVNRGQLIGLMGSTGNSTGSHLHLIMLFNGTVINPLSYLP
jgi:murein DD-endopeptidase MepM/ murein hydrolase activator NlpD